MSFDVGELDSTPRTFLRVRQRRFKLPRAAWAATQIGRIEIDFYFVQLTHDRTGVIKVAIVNDTALIVDDKLPTAVGTGKLKIM